MYAGFFADPSSTGLIYGTSVYGLRSYSVGRAIQVQDKTRTWRQKPNADNKMGLLLPTHKKTDSCLYEEDDVETINMISTVALEAVEDNDETAV